MTFSEIRGSYTITMTTTTTHYWHESENQLATLWLDKLAVQSQVYACILCDEFAVSLGHLNWMETVEVLSTMMIHLDWGD